MMSWTGGRVDKSRDPAISARTVKLGRRPPGIHQAGEAVLGCDCVSCASCPLQCRQDGLGVGGPGRLTGRREVHHDVGPLFDDGRANGGDLLVHQQQESGLRAEAPLQLVDELPSPGQLVDVHRRPDKEHGTSVCTDRTEASAAPQVALACLSIGWVVVPKRVHGAPVSKHALDARHGLGLQDVEEALEVVPQEVQHALERGAHPVEGQRG
mmetsp:Transcript_65286/g.187853  ORF Transcript_65286/g.187853 Transcript_65286/m.187853 type:complete len:211 (-) Transcript_65286:505-1137(-)